MKTSECYAFMISGLPNPALHPIRARRALKVLKDLRGMTGIHPVDMGHMLLAFRTWEQAAEARERMRDEGCSVGNNIMLSDISEDGQTITVRSPAKRPAQEGEREEKGTEGE